MAKVEQLEEILLRIVGHYTLSEQSDIQDKLREQGIDLPQSTLSRWLKRLNIVKVNHRYQAISQQPLTRIPVLGIKLALPNLIVLHTHPGQASPLAYQFDQNTPKHPAPDHPYYGVQGTIAGDDTLLIIMQDKDSLLAFKERLEGNFANFYILLT